MLLKLQPFKVIDVVQKSLPCLSRVTVLAVVSISFYLNNIQAKAKVSKLKSAKIVTA